MKPGVTPVVLTDNMSAHRQPEVVAQALQHGVLLFFLPANVTHFLNPLDDLCFTSFKRGLLQLVRESAPSLSLKRAGLEEATLNAALEARDKLTPKVVRAAWRNVGLYPWDPAKIIKNARLNVGDISDLHHEPDSDYDRALKCFREEIHAIASNDGAGSTRSQKPERKRLKLYDSQSIVDAEEQKKAVMAKMAAEKAAKKEARAKARAARTEAAARRAVDRENHACRGGHPKSGKPKVFRGGKGWSKCNLCDSFYLCPACKRPFAQRLVEHKKKKHASQVKKRHTRQPPAKQPRSIDWLEDHLTL
jgi:hypothetical protein